MLRSTCMLVFGLATAALAQESSYTGPMFNPSDAPFFDYNSVVFPTLSSLPAIQPTNEFSMAFTISGIVVPSTLSRSLSSSVPTSRASSQSASATPSSETTSRTASSSVSSVATSTSASAPAQQSTGAAVANRAGVVGAVAGGLLAGLALA